LHKRLQRFTRLLQAVEDGDVQAVHRARVASRRLREVLPVLQLDPDAVDKIGRRLRKVTKRLGSVRELDVQLGVLGELRAAGRHSEAALARIVLSVEQERSQARERHLAKSQIRELRRVGAKLEKLARSFEERDAGDWGQRRSGRAASLARQRSCRWAVQARVGRRAATLARAIAQAGAVYLPERLHAVRIAAKKLRYALELDADLRQVKSSPDITELRRTQDILGRLHDLQVLVDRTREEQASLAPPDVNIWRGLDVLVRSLEDECRRLHGRYMHHAASLVALCARLSGRAEEVRREKSRVRRT
jgi:CHAD domain-containing protein